MHLRSLVYTSLVAVSLSSISSQSMAQESAGGAPECVARYNEFRAGWSAIENELRPKLDAATKETNFYLRSEKLVQLATEVQKRSEQKRLTLRLKHSHAAVGFSYDVLSALFDTYKKNNREFFLFSALYPVWGTVKLARESGRPFSSDELFERDLFCKSEVKLRSEYSSFAAEKLRTEQFISAERFAAVESKHRELVRSASKALYSAKFERIPHAGDGAWSNKAEPKLRQISNFTIDRIEQTPTATKLTLSHSRAIDKSFNCKNNGSYRLDIRGEIVANRTCQSQRTNHSITAVLTFTDLPPSLVLEKGNRVTALVDLEKESVKSGPSTQGAAQKQVQLTLKGRQLVKVIDEQAKVLFQTASQIR